MTLTQIVRLAKNLVVTVSLKTISVQVRDFYEYFIILFVNNFMILPFYINKK